MDGHQFDKLAVVLASGTTRRRLNRFLVAGGLGGLFIPFRNRGAAAQDCWELLGLPCQSDEDCQGDGETLLCPTQACCNWYCVDTLWDPTNCGGCEIWCPAEATCEESQCVPVCPEGLQLCGHGCADLSFDPSNCGECGVVCPDQTCCAGTCVDIGTDQAHCGACFASCPFDAYCEQGQCIPYCQDGAVLCGDACVDAQNDSANCGDCGVVCPSGAECIAGSCSTICPPGSTACDEACVDISSDPANCGECGAVCPSGSECSAGRCGTACPSGLAFCDGECVDILTDPANCGGCRDRCSGRCVDGDCEGGTCTVESGESGLTYRSKTRAPEDGFVIRSTSMVEVDESGADTIVTNRITISDPDETLIRFEWSALLAGGWTSTVQYGKAFEGIRRAVFSRRDDQVIIGEIDGRTLEPFSPQTDPTAIVFADGKPAPELRVDDSIVRGIERVLAQAQAEATLCEPALPEASAVAEISFRRMSRPQLLAAASLIGNCDAGHVSYPPLGSKDCVLCRGKCLAAGMSCGYGVGLGCAGGCAAALVGYGLCVGVCLGIGLASCTAVEVACLLDCRKPGSGCCPVGCSDGGCCKADEICLNPASGLCCAPPFTQPCHNSCCCRGDDACLSDGTCCPKGRTVCGDACCNAGEVCLDGSCCPKVCDKVSPRQCCDAFATCTTCGCCPAGTTCARDNYFRNLCCPNGQLCGGLCCPSGQVCKDPSTGTCFSSSGCPAGQDACPGGICCEPVKLSSTVTRSTCCGNVCCPADRPFCCYPGDATTEATCKSAGCIR